MRWSRVEFVLLSVLKFFDEMNCLMNTRPARFHVALRASRARFEDSVAFYTALFGQPPAKLRPGYAKFDIAEPSINLTLNQTDQICPSLRQANQPPTRLRPSRLVQST